MAVIFMVLTMQEADKIQENEVRFRALPCDQMKLETSGENWQNMAYFDKGCN